MLHLSGFCFHLLRWTLCLLICDISTFHAAVTQWISSSKQWRHSRPGGRAFHCIKIISNHLIGLSFLLWSQAPFLSPQPKDRFQLECHYFTLPTAFKMRVWKHKCIWEWSLQLEHNTVTASSEPAQGVWGSDSCKTPDNTSVIRAHSSLLIRISLGPHVRAMATWSWQLKESMHQKSLSC